LESAEEEEDWLEQIGWWKCAPRRREKTIKKNVALFNLKDSLALDFLGLTTGYKKV
jgi:hypothetical protein